MTRVGIGEEDDSVASSPSLVAGKTDHQPTLEMLAYRKKQQVKAEHSNIAYISSLLILICNLSITIDVTGSSTRISTGRMERTMKIFLPLQIPPSLPI